MVLTAMLFVVAQEIVAGILDFRAPDEKKLLFDKFSDGILKIKVTLALTCMYTECHFRAKNCCSHTCIFVFCVCDFRPTSRPMN